MINFQNSYYIPNVTCYGYICKTNAPSNTVFRGTGAPQAMLLGETMIRHVAETLCKDIIEVKITFILLFIQYPIRILF
jgi:xanthine dehydrogenase/oxidase